MVELKKLDGNTTALEEVKSLQQAEELPSNLEEKEIQRGREDSAIQRAARGEIDVEPIVTEEAGARKVEGRDNLIQQTVPAVDVSPSEKKAMTCIRNAATALAGQTARATEITELHLGDLELLRAVERVAKDVALEEKGEAYGRDHGALVSAYRLDKYVKFLENPDCHLFVSKDAGNVTGFAMVYSGKVIDPADPTQELNFGIKRQIEEQNQEQMLCIKQIGIASEHQGKGVGSEMYEFLTKWAADEGFGYLYAAIVNDNTMPETMPQHLKPTVPLHNTASQKFHSKNRFFNATPGGFVYKAEMAGHFGPTGAHCREAWVKPLKDTLPPLTISFPQDNSPTFYAR